MSRRAKLDDPAVLELCEHLVPGVSAVTVKVDAPPNAEIGECVPNVEWVIEKYQGSIQYGWLVWETLPGVLLEAEFHAVWRRPTGQLLDVTPKIESDREVTFLPDASLSYEGRQIDNVRVALRDDPLIHEFIQSAEDFFRVTNRGALADYHGPLHVTPELEAILVRRNALEQKLISKYFS